MWKSFFGVIFGATTIIAADIGYNMWCKENCNVKHSCCPCCKCKDDCCKNGCKDCKGMNGCEGGNCSPKNN